MIKLLIGKVFANSDSFLYFDYIYILYHPTDCMGLFQHLMTSVFGTAKHCPADVSMSQRLQLHGCCFAGDPVLETWRSLPQLTTMNLGTVLPFPARRPLGKNSTTVTSPVCDWSLQLCKKKKTKECVVCRQCNQVKKIMISVSCLGVSFVSDLFIVYGRIEPTFKVNCHTMNVS